MEFFRISKAVANSNYEMSIKECKAIRMSTVDLKSNTTFTLDREYKLMIFDKKKFRPLPVAGYLVTAFHFFSEKQISNFWKHLF